MSAKKHLYLVDDDPDIRNIVCGILEDYNYVVTGFGSGREALQAIREAPPDLCLVDLGLPDIDGLTLVRELWGDTRFGVIILTGRGGVSDRVLGLELGADDYIVKPFEPRELVARVNSVIRRREQLVASSAAASVPNRVRFGDWTLDMGTMSLVARDGRKESLTAAEMSLLMSLLKAPKRVLSREHLLGCEADRDEFPFDRNIDVRISRIRKKLGDDPKAPRLIKTVYGAGYLLTTEVEWVV